MVNTVTLVGRLTTDPSIIDGENDNKRTVINLAVPRSFKNQDGIYECDFIRCVLWNGIATKATTYCRSGDLIAIRGRIQSRSYEKDNETKFITEVIAEFLSFIQTKGLKDDVKV